MHNDIMAASGFLRTCIDNRFVAESRKAFESKTGLAPDAYFHESYPGGAARDASPISNDPKTGNNLYADEYAANNGARIFGWQAHLNGCGGLPGATDAEIIQALNKHIAAMVAKYAPPTFQHYRIIASPSGVVIEPVNS